MHASIPDPDGTSEPEPRLDLPDPRAEARLDAALAAPALDAGLRQRLVDLGPAGDAASAAPAVAGRVGFGGRGAWRVGLAAAAALAATTGIGLIALNADAPASDGLVAGTPASTGAAASPADLAAARSAPTLAHGVDDATDPAEWPEEPALLALAEAARASGLPAEDTPDTAEPGSVAHRLAELEDAADDPWARSAWASVEADALFAEDVTPASLF